jgi:hypothetical protein
MNSADKITDDYLTIREMAEKELMEERTREAVDEMKVRLRRPGKSKTIEWFHKVFPYKIVKR